MKNMEMYPHIDRTHCSGFKSDTGCEEFFLTVRTGQEGDFVSALQSLEDDYAALLKQSSLSDATTVFSRLFVSDFMNQQQKFDGSLLVRRLKAGALSIIEEKPVGGGPLSLFSYHIRNPGYPAGASNSAHVPGECGNTARYSGKNYSLFMTANYTDNETFDAGRQTGAIFKNFQTTLERNGMRLLDNTIRTWIFVRDIDNHYRNMTRARREYFDGQGLTDKTRFLASTGIEGGCESPDRIVSVDSLSISPLKPGQIVRMEAPAHLSPTIRYGVTFERGLRVRFGDRSHLYISGTASIDARGDVMFPGDVTRQAERTIENLRALLAAQKATLNDMAYYIFYVRNFHEWEQVRKVITREIGNAVPMISVEATVCRPAWLFELEGVAVIPDANEFPHFM